MKAQFYGKQDYSEEGQKRKTKEIEASIDRRIQKQMNLDSEPFNFKLTCEEPNIFQRIKKILRGD